MKLLLICLLSILSLSVFAEGDITGKDTVSPGETQTYTVNWSSWEGIHESVAIVNWTVTNGTVISSDKHTVTIQWDGIPSWLNATGMIQVSEDLTGMFATRSVEIFNFRLIQSVSCNGVLGPSAIYEDFGKGLNPGPALGPNKTNYVYRNNCTLFSGEYTITNSTVGCRGPWLGIPDHTPNDVNGYMLMVDGSENRGEVYRTTVNGLASSFKYEFSVWVANLTDLNGTETPKMNFQIHDLSGNVIEKSDNIEIFYDASNPWKRISFMFDLPLNMSSVQILLVNENNDSYGNDFVVDDLTFAPCYSPILASFSSSTGNIVDVAEKCNNGSNTIYSRWPTSVIPYTNPSFQWERSVNDLSNWTDIFGATNMSYLQTESVPGIYYYRVKAYETGNPSQFVYSNYITFFVQKITLEATTFNLFGCNNGSMTLYPNYSLNYYNIYGSNKNLAFSWTPGTFLNNATIANPIITLPPLVPNTNPTAPPPAPIIRNYNLTVSNPSFPGCTASKIQTIAQYNPRKVAVPSVFSPNSDGVNDFFRPINLEDYPGGKFWVYNRWGQNIFYSQGPGAGSYSWDGKFNGVNQPIGNYVWKVEIPGCPTNIFNASMNNNSPNGWVILAR
jgi:gliding motility-associated-like protein